MNPRIEIFSGKKLAGKKMYMSIKENKTFDLWRSFMPEKCRIPNQVGEELYSVDVFPNSYFEKYDPYIVFEKWAAVEISGIGGLPEDVEILGVPEGTYAVFVHKGPDVKAPETFNYIFREWLPSSGYIVDERPHMAIMGENYKRESMDSQEEIWIPVKELITR